MRLKISHIFYTVVFLSLLATSVLAKSTVSCNAENALAIAKKEVRKIYGRRIFNRERPFNIKSENDSLFIVSGTHKFSKGGTAVVHIYKTDCSIKKVEHYK